VRFSAWIQGCVSLRKDASTPRPHDNKGEKGSQPGSEPRGYIGHRCGASLARAVDHRARMGGRMRPPLHVTNGSAPTRSEVFAAADALFGVHVLEFAGLEDLAAVFTLNELGVFIAADDGHTKVLAGLRVWFGRRSGRRLGRHKSGSAPQFHRARGKLAGISGYFRTGNAVVKCQPVKTQEFAFAACRLTRENQTIFIPQA